MSLAGLIPANVSIDAALVICATAFVSGPTRVIQTMMTNLKRPLGKMEGLPQL